MKSRTLHSLSGRRSIWAVFVLIAAVSPHPALAQSVWELTPYQVVVLLGVEESPELRGDLVEHISRHVTDRAVAVVGAGWRLECRVAPVSLSRALTRGIAITAEESQGPEWAPAGADKVILVGVRSTIDGRLSISAREWDANTRTLGVPMITSVPQRALAPDEAWRLIQASCSPLARIDQADKNQATLRVRASSLPPRDPSLSWVEPGTIFRPVLRFNDSRGNLRGLQAIPWTYLTVVKVADDGVTATLRTGLRTPLTNRGRGRIEQLAVGLPRIYGSTRLVLRSRTEQDRKLSGYEVFAQDGDDESQVERVGRTDTSGSIRVPPHLAQVRTIYIKSGDELVAKLPLVPGLAGEIVADLADDRARLTAESVLFGWQENFVDMVARRRVLESRVRSRLEEGELDEAQSLLAELRGLGSPQELAVHLRQERQKLSTTDPVVRAKVDKLFSDTQELINRHLDFAEVGRLERELAAAKSAAPASPAR